MNFPPEITFATSTIADGNMSFRFSLENEVIANRDKFCQKLNIAVNSYICMACDHGSTITPVNWSNGAAYLGAQTPENMIQAEVLITKEPGLTLMLLTADCLPTAFYDPVTKTIALAHFSRQTIADGLPQKTVSWLRQEYQVNPANLQVLVGPHIHPQSYCFPNTGELLPNTIEPFITRDETEIFIDLPAAHNDQLNAAGVPKENIQYSTVDTFSSPKHFSHFVSTRNDKKPHGRFATVLQLKS